MRKRIIKNSRDLNKAIEYYNSFHDGFLKSIKLVSGNKFVQKLPWEKARRYESTEEKLLDTSLSSSEKAGLFIEIHHYNYDWPNKPPNNQVLLYLQNVKTVDAKIVQMIGVPVYDCEVMTSESGMGMRFIFDKWVGNKYERIELEPLNFTKIAIWERS